MKININTTLSLNVGNNAARHKLQRYNVYT